MEEVTSMLDIKDTYHDTNLLIFIYLIKGGDIMACVILHYCFNLFLGKYLKVLMFYCYWFGHPVKLAPCMGSWDV